MVSFFIFLNFYLFIYLFLAVLGLRFCARDFSGCGERGPLLIAVRGPPTIAASPVAEHRLQTRRLSCRGSRAKSLRGMRDPPRPGIEPMSPALAGRLSTTAPPGKPCHSLFEDELSPALLLPKKEANTVVLRFSKCGSWTSISWELVRSANPWALLHIY